jgi:ssDNA-binding Zn-finger/Zn-ribbon topoisomerase 1
VSDALTQVALIIMKANGFKLEHNDKSWKGFMSTIREGGWDYLEKMAKEYRSDTERALVSINVCPECESKLTRKHVEGKTIVSCSSCGKAYEILDK